MDVIGGFIALGFVVIFVVAAFLIFRQAALWYWRVNEVHDQLRDMNEALDSVYDRLNEIAALLREANREKTP